MISYPGKFALIMLDVLQPKFEFRILLHSTSYDNKGHNGDKLVGFRVITTYNNQGEPIGEEIKGPLVPNYNNAIDHYLDNFPTNRSIKEFNSKPASEKVKIAYSYIWTNFQNEINETSEEQDLLLLHSFFDDSLYDLGRYKVLKEYIIAERERVFRRPDSSDGLKGFIKHMGDSHHIITLLSCLESVCEIINDGTELISKRLRILKNFGLQAEDGSDVSVGFESYLMEKYHNLIPFLKEKYTNKKPKHYVPMLFALQEYMSTPLDKCKQIELHKAWSSTFGDVGGYKAFNAAVSVHNNTSNSDKQQMIKDCKGTLVKSLKSG